MYLLRSMRGRNVASALVFLFLLSGVALRPGSGIAAGALAVALPAEISKTGFSYGYSTAWPDANQAAAEALKQCQTTKDAAASANLRSLCKVIQNFSNQCIAVAMDPGAGTPGVGWGIAANAAKAQSVAMANCKKTAGPTRQGFCKMDNQACDGTAK
jgi:hypothetical protein